jgi:hypothetical protein
MSLRKKDDWDEALEETSRNQDRVPTFIPGPDYDYGISVVIKREDWEDKEADEVIS